MMMPPQSDFRPVDDAMLKRLNRWSLGEHFPFAGTNADRAQSILRGVYATMTLISAGFDDAAAKPGCDFALVGDGMKSMAITTLSEMVALASFFIEEDLRSGD